MKEEYKHGCECITKLENGVVSFISMCNLHKKNKKYIWIALQHPKAIKKQRNLDKSSNGGEK